MNEHAVGIDVSKKKLDVFFGHCLILPPSRESGGADPSGPGPAALGVGSEVRRRGTPAGAGPTPGGPPAVDQRLQRVQVPVAALSRRPQG